MAAKKTGEFGIGNTPEFDNVSASSGGDSGLTDEEPEEIVQHEIHKK